MKSRSETSRHLFQSPLYRGPEGTWDEDFLSAAAGSGGPLNWDPATILSILGFNYACGTGTLFSEIQRQPWLCAIEDDSDPRFETIPPHDTLWTSRKEVARVLEWLLEREAARACRDHDRIYVLLSGGLDSRVVAATAAKLARRGRIPRPVAVTWGLEASRDVVYGRKAAEILGLEWIHVPLEPGHLLENIELAAGSLGGLISPIHLHRMAWFDRVPENSLVLAGSYGDMIGRAEFSGKKLLEQHLLRPSDPLELMTPAARREGTERLQRMLDDLHERCPGAPRHVRAEHEMHAHYTRGLLAHTMSVVDRYCQVYQMFTHPAVYGFMWQIHPALRTDEIYAHLLDNLHEELARLPWARTNRALRGPTRGARADLGSDFHRYGEWVRGRLLEKILPMVDPGWFEATGIFAVSGITRLKEHVRHGAAGGSARDAGATLLWLAAVRRLAEEVERRGVTIQSFESGLQQHDEGLERRATSNPAPSRWFSKALPGARKRLQVFRRQILRLKSLVDHRPRPVSESELWSVAEELEGGYGRSGVSGGK